MKEAGDLWVPGSKRPRVECKGEELVIARSRIHIGVFLPFAIG
jgi:hypothetical protein